MTEHEGMAGEAPPAIAARFGHVNITSHDWRRLAAFYTDVLGCRLVPPERDIRGPVLDSATGLTDAHLTGAHLRLPGLGDSGPTLEIFSYEALADAPAPRVDRTGLGHLAFAVPDVAAALDAVLAGGGGRIGEIVTTATADGRRVTWVYATDPDGNIIELQAWSAAPT
jgi:catechol 2,3-dioxygenase-like lactoylglutathione lyase family enzyme